jgi:hypothetical protein
MRVAVSRWLSVSTIALGLVFSANALATTPQNSDESSVVIISQGSGECNTYAIANIQSMGGNVSGLEGSFSSPNASASYTLSSDGKVFGFNNSSVPINFAILKAQSDVRIFYYKTAGPSVTADSNLRIGDKRIQSVSLCYGQGQGGVGESNPVILPRCDDLDEELLDKTGILCPESGQRRVLVSLDPDEPKWNPTLCTCNVSGSFTQCNADAEEGEEGFCPGSHPLRALPTVIEAGNDKTWVCTTVGGTRTCYKI